MSIYVYDFVSQVIENVGLCIALFDIIKIGDLVVHAGEGSAYTPVEFRIITFRPFSGEVIQGKLVSSEPEGIKGI
jgi:DNA-directed RNA polymerase III subunit RPC8